ncbi:MAG: DUF4097 family beta strand repeat-containing protein [Ignavibacteriaceae bacterium]
MNKCSAVAKIVMIFFLINSATVFSQNYKTKTFKVNKNGHLLVDLSYGDISIKTWNKNEVLVRYDDDYDEDEDGLLVKFAGNHVRIRSNNSNYSDVEVTVPSYFYVEMSTQAGDLTVKGSFVGSLKGVTSGGDISIEKVSGYTDLHTYGGDVTAEEIKGEMKILTYGGDLHLSNIDGNGTVSTSGGNIRINNVSKSIAINTAGGNIVVDEINGKVKLNTGGGNISIKNVNGDATLNTGGGNIKSLQVKGRIEASTGAGSVYLYKVDGSVKAISGSGDIHIELQNINSESRAKTNNGNIKLYIAENEKITVEVRIRGFGKHSSYDETDFIRYDLTPTSKSVNKNNDNIKATYSFNGGGRKIFLDTSYGEIEIKRLDK